MKQLQVAASPSLPATTLFDASVWTEGPRLVVSMVQIDAQV